MNEKKMCLIKSSLSDKNTLHKGQTQGVSILAGREHLQKTIIVYNMVSILLIAAHKKELE